MYNFKTNIPNFSLNNKNNCMLQTKLILKIIFEFLKTRCIIIDKDLKLKLI